MRHGGWAHYTHWRTEGIGTTGMAQRPAHSAKVMWRTKCLRPEPGVEQTTQCYIAPLFFPALSLALPLVSLPFQLAQRNQR